MNQWALFLDFDGTLVDIAETPDAVAVPPKLPYLLDELRRHLGGALALVSGRTISAIDLMLKPMTFDVAGLHGLEYRSNRRIRRCDPEAHSEIRRAVLLLAEQLRPLDGVVVEDKGCSVAVHWRLAPQKREIVVEAATRLFADLGPGYHLQLGKAVVEILPAQYSKGQAIQSFMQEPPFLGRRPIFIGDDLTDESGFRVVNAVEGISVRVGRGSTGARHFVDSPASIRALLARWVAAGRISPEFELAA
jgi:trehalose 6-phosphate phosphatase